MADSPLSLPPNSSKFIDPIRYQPSQDIPESDKNPRWYINNIRYCSTFYNLPKPRLTPNVTDQTYYGLADEYIRNFSFQKGDQQNIDFKHTQLDLYNNEVQSVWIKGQELAGLISFAMGKATEMVNNIEWSARSLSNDRAQWWENLNAQLRASLVLKKELAGTGIEYKPVEDAEIDDIEDVEDYTNKAKSDSELSAIEISNALYEQTFLKNNILKSFLHSVVAPLGSSYRYVENGQVKSKHIPSYNTIWDNRHDDVYNREAQFWGFVDWYTAPELFIKYPGIGKDPQKRAVIEAMANMNQGWQPFMNYYNGNAQNMNWWSYSGDGNRRMTVAVITMFWVGVRDSKKKVVKNKYGEERIVEIKDKKVTDKAGIPPVPQTVVNANTDNNKVQNSGGESLAGETTDSTYESGDFWIPDIYQGELIGNLYLENYGLSKNVVRDPLNKSRPILPGTCFIPEMEMGYGRSLVSRAIPNQNEMDRLKFIIQDKTAKDLGKVYIINGPKLGDPNQGGTKRLFTNLKRMGIHVTNVTGESNDVVDSMNLVNQVDMTGDPNIALYVELYHEQERIMQRIFNYNDTTMGLQSGTIGKAVQQQTISQASIGTLSLYDSFMEWVRMDMQYQLNLWKLVNGDKESATMVVGKEGAKIIKLTKGFQWEDLLIYIEPNDNGDKESQQRILVMAQAAAQNDRMDFIDYVEHIEFAENRREMLKGLKISRKQKQKEAMIAQKSQQQTEIMVAQQQALAQQQAIILQKTADQIRELEKINLKGSWDYQEVIAKLGNVMDAKIADAIINRANMDIEHQNAMVQQAAAQQPEQ